MKKNYLWSLVAAGSVALSASAVETPTMGWSSWNTYRVNISDELIRRQADAMVEKGFAACGYNHVNIDDGWFGGRDAAGRHIVHAKRFPHGLRPVVDYIHARGLKAGIYSDGGGNTCGSMYDNDVLGIGVGFYGHDAEDAAFFFKEMNFDFIKVDFCGGAGGKNKDGLTLDTRARYTAIAEAIRAVGRDDVRVNACRWDYPGTWIADAAFSWRMSADINASWKSVKSIILESLFLAPYAGGGHYNDMDMLEVGRGLTEEEDRTHFALWCLMSSPLLIGCDLTQIDSRTQALLQNRDLIAINQDCLGEQAVLLKDLGGDVLAFVRDLETSFGCVRALAMANLGDQSATVSLPLAETDLGGVIHGRELVCGGEEAIMDETLAVTLPAHATRVWRLVGEKRLVRTVYPAHWAWLSDYQEIDPMRRTASATRCPDCGFVKVDDVGGSADSWMEFRTVQSDAARAVTLAFDVLPTAGWGFDVVVNGENVGRAGPKSGFAVQAKLRAGVNLVRLENTKDRFSGVCALRVKASETK